MAKKKSAISGEYIIQIDENAKVTVFRIFDNVIASLREIAAENNFEVDPKWNTQTLGAKLVKAFGEEGENEVTIGNYVVAINSNKSVNTYRTYTNTMGALREIAAGLGFEIDPKWNTQDTGRKLVKYLNENK